MKASEQKQNSIKTEGNETSSDSEDSDSCSDISSSESVRNSQKSHKMVPQFSVLRSESDGLRMKISAVRNVQDTSDKKKTSNNNNDRSSRKNESRPNKKNESRASSSGSSSSYCSVCSRSDSDDSSTDSQQDKHRKIRLKRKKVHTMSAPAERKPAPVQNVAYPVWTSDKKISKTLAPGKKPVTEPSVSGSKKCPPQIGNDVIPTDCVSSSDTELPALVNAAIKCVESSSEMENCGSEPPLQYNSALLHDFMIKTQMLGSCTEIATLKRKNLVSEEKPTENFKKAVCETPQVSVPEKVPETHNESKKKRGRPKKQNAPKESQKILVNESLDSGITSTAQSLSPSPNSPAQRENASEKSRESRLTTNGSTDLRETTAPKISIINLEKQIYATERVLYPPRGRKKSVGKSRSSKAAKNEIDPIWKKIDVNSKFHRPILTGYKSDGGSTVCSKRRRSKSGYVSDFGAAGKHYSGYKSDRSGKSRYSTKSCASRAKSCDYRSDYSNVSRKSRRKKKSHIKHSKSFSSVNEQDILQLAGLTLGQTSEESSRESLEKTVEEPCSSKKYGEINRFIRTGEYFGGIKKFSETYKFGSSPSHMLPLDKSIFRSCGPFSGKTYPKSTPVTPTAAKDVPHENERFCSKIRSRRSSAISRCSSMSMVSKYNLKRRKRRKFRTRSQSRYSCIDPKFHIQIEILVNSFATLCRIDGESMSKFSNLKERVEREKKATTKRSFKKRKLSENLEHYQITNLKRKHKKSGHNSPDEHKLPLKKRHYLLMPGEKCDAKSFHMMESKNKELCDMKYSLKSTNNNIKVPSKPVTPKKRHLLETPHNAIDMHATLLSKYNTMPCNDLKPLLNSPERITDIVSQKLLNQVKNDIIKKKNRLEGLVSKMQSICSSAGVPTGMSINQVIEKAPPKFPPPGIFEPSSELEIQIPLTKLSAGVITKSEVDSPKVVPDDLDYERTLPEPKTERVVETLLNKTGGHLLMRKKRKKVFNRTGFPTVKKRKRKMEFDPRLSLDSMSEKKCSTNSSNIIKNKQQKASANKTDTTLCDRVPHVGEASTTFLERNKQPRLSVVSLERLQDPNKKRETLEPKQNENSEANINLIERSKKNRSSSVKTKKETSTPLVTDDQVGNNDHSVTPIQTQQSTNEAKKIEVNKTEETVKPENRKLCAKINLRRNTISLHIDNSTASETPEPEEKAINKVEKTEPKSENVTTSLKSRLRQREIENTPKRRNRTKQNQILKPIKPNAIIRKPFVKPEMKNAIVRIVRKKIDEAQSSIISDDKLVKKIKIENISNLKKPKAVAKPIKQEKSAETSDESLEQEPLPLNEGVSMENQEQIELNESFPKSKKMAKWKKTYLTAGLLSDTFKIDRQKKPNVKEKFSEEEPSEQTSLLPPPPYCEKFFRRTVYDFLLPYDIWWAHTNCKLPARVTVPSWNYRKIRTNVYGDVKPNPVVDHQVCNCKPQSGCGDDCLNRLVYTECFPTSCPSQDKCQNQKIQKHEWAPGIERFMTENKGWGVRTNLAIKKGTYILEYVGEVVTEKEFKRRMATLYVNDTHHYCLNLDGGLVIDGHRMGSDGRFVNHSCSPNCEMQKWSVNGLFRMALFALRNIESGEELTYDYNFSLFNPSEGQPCRCETPQCRGVIGGKSQRVKPVDTAKIIDPNILNRHSRARKRQAKKNSGRYQSKDVIIPQFQLPSDREKKIIKASNCFLIRNLEKVQKLKFRPIKSSEIARPLTPSSIAVQISALRVPRNIKTRGLTQAAHDPEVERMAKMAVVFRDICSELENMKDANGKSQLAKLLPATKRKRNSQDRMKKPLDFATVQTNVEKGLYKQPELFDEDMNKVFSSAITHFGTNTDEARTVDALSKAYTQMKYKAYDQLSKLVNKKSLKNFRPMQETKQSSSMKRTEDIIRCICGLFKDEGLMIQCAKCLCWQHAECTKADTKAEYSCERCVPRNVDYEIPLNEFTEEGYRYYLSLLRGKLQIRQGDTVYVLRDIPIKDENGKTYSTKKHTYETIGEVDYSECDIFRVERLWKNHEGKRFVFGHHYLRPHETFHEPTRKFYENEVVRVPLYEVVPIELVIARCWVLDRGTFCKGRPVDCTSEKHVYICELRVDKSARFFSKVRQVYPTCTKEYAFRTFPEKLKISRTYAPHEVDPALLKSRKRRPEDTPPQQRKNSYPIIQLLPPPAKTMLERRTRLEDVLRNIRLRLPDGGEPTAVDLSYLLTGRRARQRKANAASVPV